jgi:hypothetical protein
MGSGPRLYWPQKSEQGEHMICDECETVAHCLKNGCVPKQQALKPLTDDQIAQLASKYLDVGDGERGSTYVYGEIEFARAIEAKLKEKNSD